MVSFIDGLTDGLKNAYCQEVSNSPTWFSNLRNVLIPGGIVDVADRLNRWVCDRPPGDLPGLPQPEFTGGQCAGVSYRVTYGSEIFPFADCSTFGVGAATQFLTGPLLGTFRRTNQNAQFPLCTPGGNEVVMRHGSPVIETVLAGGLYGAEVTNIQVFPPDGTPDNCGDPQPVFPPSGPITVPVTINFDGSDETNYNLTVPVIFAPVYVAVNGELKIPITIGDLNFTGEIGFNPEFNIDLTFPESGGGGTPDDPALPPSGSPGLDEPEDAPGPEGTIVGVVVRATKIGGTRATVIFMEDMPDVIAPRLATVRFHCRFGSLAAWTSDLPVKGVNEYISCPSPFGAVDVEVFPETNWSVTSTPIRSRPPAIFQP